MTRLQAKKLPTWVGKSLTHWYIHSFTCNICQILSQNQHLDIRSGRLFNKVTEFANILEYWYYNT